MTPRPGSLFQRRAFVMSAHPERNTYRGRMLTLPDDPAFDATTEVIAVESASLAYEFYGDTERGARVLDAARAVIRSWGWVPGHDDRVYVQYELAHAVNAACVGQLWDTFGADGGPL